MECEATSELIETVEIRRWELNVLLVEFMLLGGLAMASVVTFLMRVGHVSETAAFGVGSFFLGASYIPVESILWRRSHAGQFSVVRSLLWIGTGSVVGAAVYAFMR
jgi:hypothetical protein